MRQGAAAAGATNLKFIFQIVDAYPGDMNGNIYRWLNSKYRKMLQKKRDRGVP